VTYADKYKGRFVVVVVFEIRGIYSWDVDSEDLGPYAGFDHYYNVDDGTGLRLTSEYLAKTIVFQFLSHIVDIGIAHFKVEFRPDILPHYPSAIDLAQEHYQLALNNYQSLSDLKWPHRSRIYNTLFQAGWSCHFIQDMGVIHHQYNEYLGDHEGYENRATSLGDPNDYPEYHAQNKDDWTMGRNYLDVSVKELGIEAANKVYNSKTVGDSFSDDSISEYEARKIGLKVSEQYTAAVLAKLLTDLNIPEKVPPLEGQIKDFSTRTPIPFAYVFYKERTVCKNDLDTGSLCALNNAAWDYVRTDQNGHYLLNLKPGKEYFIRPAMPGYKFEGKHDTYSGDLAFTNVIPFKWTQPEYVDNPYNLKTFLLDPREGSMVYLDSLIDLPVSATLPRVKDIEKLGMIQPGKMLPISKEPLSPAIATAINQATMEVKADHTLLASQTSDDPMFQITLPNETYIEVRLSRLIDLTTGNTIQTPSDLVSLIDLGNQRKTERKMLTAQTSPKRDSDQISPIPVREGNTQDQEKITIFAKKEIYPSLATPATWLKIKNALPTQQISDSTGTMKNVTLYSYGSRSQSSLLSEMPIQYGIFPVPSQAGVEIEVTLSTNPNTIGPEFSIHQSQTYSPKIKDVGSVNLIPKSNQIVDEPKNI
ncbi:MAG: hypothetical protein NTY95_17535, partial [Bacteroidia bacterium]|nr:hypothetical protein [Bacteroidia bacterium]